MLKQYRLRDYRFRLVCYVFAITIIGILVIGSAEKSVQDQQILGLFLGTAAMIVISLIDYNWVLKFRWLIYGFNLLLLVLVIRTPLGYENNGATRWLRLGGFQFQPSELCKLCLILFFAKFLDRYKEMLNTVGEKMRVTDPLKTALIAGLFVTDELITKTADLKPIAERENRISLQLSDLIDRLDQCL